MLSRFRSSAGLLAALYFGLAFPVVVFQVFATPPFQVADEENHFLRALEVARGHFIARRLSDTASGDDLDPAAVTAAHAFDALKFHPDVKLDMETYAQAAALAWGSEPDQPATFANTAVYPAFFYLPSAAGLKLGEMFGSSVLDSLRLARLLTAMASMALATTAILVCARGRAVLFVILCFPMILSLFASTSQDALSLASGALAIAVWSRYLALDRDVPFVPRAGVALLLGCIVAARIPLIALYALLLVPTSSERRAFTRTWVGRDALVAAAVGLLPIAVGIVGADAAKIAFKSAEGVAPREQVRWLLTHPLGSLDVAMTTLGQFGVGYLRQMVGVLGWLDTDLPEWYYVFVAFGLAAACLLEVLSPTRALTLGGTAMQVVIVLAATAGVFVGLYVAWTPVGGTFVDGVQGRYLLVPAMFLILAIPALGVPGILRVPPRLADAQAALCGIVAATTLWVVPMTILHRYYG